MARPALDHLTIRGQAERDRVVDLWCDPATVEAVRAYVERTLGS